MALDYFAGGVPPFVILKLELDQIDGLVRSSEQKLGKRAAEMGLIGLCAYFEAFANPYRMRLAKCSRSALFVVSSTTARLSISE